MLVEHARNLIGIADAVHAEYEGPGTPVVTLLACSLADNEIDIAVTPGSKLHDIYGADTGQERTTCNYGLAPAFDHIARTAGLRVGAVDDTGEVRAVERDDHPFFMATLYQPQLSSSPAHPHPIWSAFVAACSARPM